MKTLKSLSALTLAFALLGSSTAHANTKRHISPVAQMTVSNYFGYQFRHDVKIYNDGHVTTSTNGGTEILVATLEQPVLDHMANTIAGIERAELVDRNPDRPECADAPTTTYLIYKDGEPIKTQQIMNCKIRENEKAYSARAINDLLSAFGSLDL